MKNTNGTKRIAGTKKSCQRKTAVILKMTFRALPSTKFFAFVLAVLRAFLCVLRPSLQTRP
jgi:hypothetical protein